MGDGLETRAERSSASGFQATVAVVGFPRCGSSMMMRMLDAGGVPPVATSAPVAYELESLDLLPRMRQSDLAGRAIKLLDYALWHPTLPAADWRFIWLDRNAEQQAKSQIKFMRGIASVEVARSAWRRLAQSLRHDRARLIARYREHGLVHVESYEAILANPADAVARLARFIPGLNVERASSVVTDRSPSCAPDLAFEMSGLDETQDASSTPSSSQAQPRAGCAHQTAGDDR